MLFIIRFCACRTKFPLFCPTSSSSYRYSTVDLAPSYYNVVERRVSHCNRPCLFIFNVQAKKKKKIKDINKKLNAAAYASLSQRKINPSGELRQKKKMNSFIGSELIALCFLPIIISSSFTLEDDWTRAGTASVT